VEEDKHLQLGLL